MATIRAAQYSLFSLLFIGYVLYILCRRSYSLIIPFIVHEHNVSLEVLGAVMSSHNLAFAFSKLFFGLGSYMLGARLVFSAGLFVTSLCVLTFSFISHMTYLTPIWFVSGIAQGCGWPAVAQLVSMWYPVHERGTAWSLLAGSVNLPGILNPILAPYFIASFGYRAYMLLIAIFGMLVSFCCVAMIKDEPKLCGFDNFATPNSNPENLTGGDNVMKLILKSPALWILAANNLTAYSVTIAFDSWNRLYMMEERHMHINQIGLIMSSFEMGGLISCIFTGFITDSCVKNKSTLYLNEESNPRLLVSTVYSFIAVLAFHYVRTAQPTSLYIPAAVLGITLYGCINIYGVVAIEEAPRKLGASVHAISAFIASLGTVLTGLPLSSLADFTSWSFAFLLLQICLAASFGLSFMTYNSDMKIGKKVKTD